MFETPEPTPTCSSLPTPSGRGSRRARTIGVLAIAAGTIGGAMSVGESATAGDPAPTLSVGVQTDPVCDDVGEQTDVVWEVAVSASATGTWTVLVPGASLFTPPENEQPLSQVRTSAASYPYGIYAPGTTVQFPLVVDITVGSADPIRVEQTGTFVIPDDCTVPVTTLPDGQDPVLGLTSGCSSFEGARFLVVEWTYGPESGIEQIPLGADEGPGDTVDVTISTSTGALSTPVVVPNDPICGTVQVETTTTLAGETTTTSVASTTTTVVASTTTVATPPTTAPGQSPPCVTDCLPSTGTGGTLAMAAIAFALVAIGSGGLLLVRRREV